MQSAAYVITRCPLIGHKPAFCRNDCTDPDALQHIEYLRFILNYIRDDGMKPLRQQRRVFGVAYPVRPSYSRSSHHWRDAKLSVGGE